MLFRARCCQRGCSYASARANDGGGKVRALCGWVQDLRRIEYSLCLRENFAKLVCAEGLQQIILQPDGNEVAIKTHIIDMPGCNDHGSRSEERRVGKSVSVRVDRGGRGNNKKKKQTQR